MSWWTKRAAKDPSFEEKLERRVTETVRQIVTEALHDAESAITKVKDMFSLSYEIKQLKERLEKTKIEKDRQDEEHARKIREVEHKVGLEKRRQEAEAEQAKKDIELAKREAVIGVREENLAAERKAFEDRMREYEKHADARLKDLQEIIKPLLKALPSAEIIARLGKSDNGA